MTDRTQTIFYGYAEEMSKELRALEIGSHILIEYPDLQTLREMYTHYTKFALYDGNEVVVILQFYETADIVRRVLSEDSACIDVRKCEKEQALLIIDSLQGYFGSKDGLMPFVKQTVEYAKSSGRSSMTVLGDMGSFFYYGEKDDLIGWENKLPHKFEIDLKGFCLYHKKDYEARLSKGDKLKLSRHHSKTIHLLPHSIPR
jgi:hypothetical protein